MDNRAYDRAVDLGKYISETGATVRQAAAKHCVSKSTVHSDVTKKLKEVNPLLYEEVRKVLDENKKLRHIRGGMATKKKYAKK